ncbi:MAG TPA: polysaccharide deacetylase family protein [Solirubrobacterales bacterium]|nr:polysaccharide deacetylase family protein [Solirubrobacterales bacterium]
MEGTSVTRPAAGGPARDVVGYGATPPRVRWPEDNLVAVNFVINYEEGSEVSHAEGDGANERFGGESDYPFPPDVRDLAQESMYEYGSRAGIWRLLRLFDEYGIKATFSACARAFELNPGVATAGRAAGHDLLCHGWRWEEHWPLGREEEAEHIARAVASFERTWGERPRGYYCRYGPSVNTRELVAAEGGFLYDSDAYNDDYPYYTEVAGQPHLVVPYTLTYNDFTVPKAVGNFLDICRRGFDEYRREGEAGMPKMMSIGLHPRAVGHAGRVNALRELIEHMLASGGVWFARRIEIAEWWSDHHGEFVGEDR